jgi:hypothetical protein
LFNYLGDLALDHVDAMFVPTNDPKDIILVGLLTDKRDVYNSSQRVDGSYSFSEIGVPEK